VLLRGGTGLDAIEAAINVLEDSPLFNAGKGSVLTANGKIEMDASVMEGKGLHAGAVAGVRTIKNPISAARAVMEKSPHVLLIQQGAEEFAQIQGLKIVDPEYFFTARRKGELKNIQKTSDSTETGKIFLSEDLDKFGTVGAVALDKYGNLYAGTSTGGMANKKFGRIGDSPIIGAGTYADNNTCAVSCTGHGEYFIRLQAARDVAALMEYKELSVKEASEEVIHKKLTALGGTGGMIVLDKKGNFVMTFNTAGMFRGYKNADNTETFLFK
jgi:L-asparaginase / beta-aspartyl-peptidase